MKYISTIAFAAVAVSAAPFEVSDTSILQYALTLEHLENTFYKEGLSKNDAGKFKGAGYSDYFYSNILLVAADEAAHVAALTTALGDKAVGPCEYNFGDISTPDNFMNTASVLEGVGVSAYLGAAGDIKEKAYLAVAGSILTTEARHSAYIRGGKNDKQRPFAAPYDVGLDYRQVFTLAAGFITSCPVDLGLKAFPPLTIGMAKSYNVGDHLTLTTDGKSSCKGSTTYACFTIPGVGVMCEEASMGNDGSCAAMIPEGAAGQTYVVLQCGNEKPKMFADESILAGPGIIEVGM